LISFVEDEKLTIRYEFGSFIFNEVGRVVVEKSLIARCFKSGKTIIERNTLIYSREIYGDKLSIPLFISGEVVGVVFMESGTVGIFDDINLEFLEDLSRYISIAIQNAEMYDNIYKQKQEIETLYEESSSTKEELKYKNDELVSYSEEMQSGYFQMVMALANSIEAMDSYTRGHCQRVMEIACGIAKEMGLSEKAIEDLKYIAILHDIGKIGIPTEILNKTERLSDSEMDIIRKHPLISYNILKGVKFIKEGLIGILQHHERYDGKGYPYGVSGEEISEFGRILCIADAVDAMTSDRPYRKAMSFEAAIEEIKRCKGTQFDPEIADIFVNMGKSVLEY
jgi:HD-GYP domain-containing protein (c-di-GMP phosphodiesterase class II)